jgi:hypothetical protein
MDDSVPGTWTDKFSNDSACLGRGISERAAAAGCCSSFESQSSAMMMIKEAPMMMMMMGGLVDLAGRI